ncbi:MAG: hypothetical protein KTR24_15225 [Saprospiraceae bacterium]|nr:hypothetical protein [Saprospiraceae bacterium]
MKRLPYLAMAGLLWKYALATTLFAIANIFVYYFLALKQYVPVIITACFALLQLVGIILYHHSLAQVVMVQMVMMSFLCISQWGYFLMYRSQQA